jgi:hypothetical protein
MQFSDKPATAVGTLTLVTMCIVVVAFMALSLAVTAIGTARFVVAMGYDANVGYAVGAIFDLAKGFLLVALLAVWGRRPLGLAAVFGTAWACVVTFRLRLAGLRPTPPSAQSLARSSAAAPGRWRSAGARRPS